MLLAEWRYFWVWRLWFWLFHWSALTIVAIEHIHASFNALWYMNTVITHAFYEPPDARATPIYRTPNERNFAFIWRFVCQPEYLIILPLFWFWDMSIEYFIVLRKFPSRSALAGAAHDTPRAMSPIYAYLIYEAEIETQYRCSSGCHDDSTCAMPLSRFSMTRRYTTVGQFLVMPRGRHFYDIWWRMLSFLHTLMPPPRHYAISEHDATFIIPSVWCRFPCAAAAD